MVDFRGERAKQIFVRGDLAGEAHRQHGPAVEGAVKGDDPAPTGVGARYLDGVFNRFGTRGNENRFFLRATGSQRIKFFRQSHRAVVGCDHDAGMAEVLQLACDRGHNFRVAVPGAADRDTGAKIDIAFALDIPHFGTERALDKNRGKIALGTRDSVVLARLPFVVGQIVSIGNFQLCFAHWSMPPIHMYLISR